MKLIFWGSALVLLTLLTFAFIYIRIERNPVLEDWITPRL